MEYRAALYVRLSKEDENSGPSESVNNQRAMLEEYALTEGITVQGVYVDDGWSGTSFDRPAFQRMLCAIEDGSVNMVVTKDLSRLGRDYILTGYYMERYFPERQVRYVSLLDGIDTAADTGANDITPFRAIMNDLYARDISRKIKSVKRDKQRRGLFIGGKPMYGYRMHPTEKNRIVPDEPAAQVVRRVFAMAEAGQSCGQIAAALNAERIPPPAVYCGWREAGKWSGERISELLRSEVYLGHMVQGRSVKVSYKSKKCLRRPSEQWTVVPGTHAAIVDKAQFDAVQRRLASRRHTRCRSYDHPLKGLIFCRECGEPLTVINRKNAAGADVLYFLCRTYRRSPGTDECTSHCIRAETVTQAVDSVCAPFLRRELLYPSALQMAEEAEKRGSGEAARSALRSRIVSLSAGLERVYLDRVNGLLTEEDFGRVFRRIDAERSALEEKLRRTELHAAQMPAEERAAALTEAFLTMEKNGREVYSGLIERMELSAERQLVIRFRFRMPEAFSSGASLALGAAESIPH